MVNHGTNTPPASSSRSATPPPAGSSIRGAPRSPRQIAPVKIWVRRLKDGAGDSHMDPFVVVHYGPPPDPFHHIKGRTGIVKNGGPNSEFDEELEIQFKPNSMIAFKVTDIDPKSQQTEDDTVGRTQPFTIEGLRREPDGTWEGWLPLARLGRQERRGQLLVKISNIPVPVAPVAPPVAPPMMMQTVVPQPPPMMMQTVVPQPPPMMMQTVVPQVPVAPPMAPPAMIQTVVPQVIKTLVPQVVPQVVVPQVVPQVVVPKVVPIMPEKHLPPVIMPARVEPTVIHQEEPEIVYHEQIVEVPKVVMMEREEIVEVPEPQIRDRIVPIPQIQVVERVQEIQDDDEIDEIIREVPIISVKVVERVVEVPVVEYKDVYREVPVKQTVVRTVPRIEVREIPIERIIRVPKKIVQEKEQPIYKPVPHLVRQPVEREIQVPRVQIETKEVVTQVAWPEKTVDRHVPMPYCPHCQQTFDGEEGAASPPMPAPRAAPERAPEKSPEREIVHVPVPVPQVVHVPSVQAPTMTVVAPTQVLQSRTVTAPVAPAPLYSSMLQQREMLQQLPVEESVMRTMVVEAPREPASYTPPAPHQAMNMTIPMTSMPLVQAPPAPMTSFAMMQPASCVLSSPQAGCMGPPSTMAMVDYATPPMPPPTNAMMAGPPGTAVSMVQGPPPTVYNIGTPGNTYGMIPPSTASLLPPRTTGSMVLPPGTAASMSRETDPYGSIHASPYASFVMPPSANPFTSGGSGMPGMPGTHRIGPSPVAQH